MKSIDYVMKKESHPSLCEHWMPDDGLHEMSNTCWCKPIVENKDDGSIGAQAKTTVRHRPTSRGIT